MTDYTSEEIEAILAKLERFEASPSIANTGTGARSEGEDFEKLVCRLWDALADGLIELGTTSSQYVRKAKDLFRRITVDGRSIYLPTSHVVEGYLPDQPSIVGDRSRWFDRVFSVDALVGTFPGTQEAINRYAPKKGRYASADYPSMYKDRKTEFDATIVLEDSGVLSEKILLEYKTAKSSRGISLDGNAHERLSFQVLQYLEAATLYPRCSLLVLANGAFAFYKNKYHVNFHIQADRLANFAWFSMDHVCTVPEYRRFVTRLVSWLERGA